MADEKEQGGQPKHEQWKTDFYTDFEATSEQRDKTNEELRFAMVPGGQWEGFLTDSMENRAKLELDQASDYLYRTYAQWTENRVSVNFAPDDDASTDDDAELLDGLFRRDLQRKNGQAAIDVAVFEAMGGGYGAVQLNTEYEDEEDPDSHDQCISFGALPSAYAVAVFDSAAKLVDKSDARRCTVLIPHSPEGFKDKYPDAVADSAVTPQDRSMFNWSTPKLIWEGVRYEVRVEATTVYTYGDPISQDIVRLTEADRKEDEPELKAAGYELLSKKRVKRRNVYRMKFCGNCVLEEERRIAGKYIPVIPFYGYMAHLDGVPYWHGVIRKRMDGQRALNMTLSLLAESAASADSDKPIFDPEQMPAGVKETWKGDRHQKAYFLAKALRNKDGSIAQTGPVAMLQGATQSQAAQSLLQTVHALITQGTGGAPQEAIDPQTSGKAVNAVLRRVDMNTQPIFDNIKTSMRHLGEVYRCIAAEVYADREGRSTSIVTQEGERQRVTLLQPQGKGGQIVYGNDVSRGKFEVIVDTGPSFQTQREETITALKDIVQAIPPGDPLGRIVLSRIIEMLPAQGMDDIKTYIRKQLLLAGVRQPESEEDFAVLEQMSQKAGDVTPQDQLVLAAASAQQTEAMLNAAKVAETRSKVIANQAKASLDLAKVREIRQGARQPQGIRQPLRLVSRQ